VRFFVIGDADKYLRRAAIGAHPHDALTALSKQEAVAVPAHAVWILGHCDGHRGASGNGNSLDGAIDRRPEREDIAIR
jgi:hypothetical protein